MSKELHMFTYTLMVIGAVNWGLVGLFGADFNVVAMLLGAWPMLERVVYILVGASALIEVVNNKEMMKMLGGK